MEPPFYVHIPSVRKSISGCLEKWFVHAIEARAGRKFLKELRSEARREESRETRTRLEKMGNILRTRNLLGRKRFGSKIHFVIADNAAFFYEKPVEETHTPQAVALARILNRLGNRYGVYVHYITPNEMRLILPPEIIEKNIDENPLAHAYKGRIKMSPGAATNVALSFVAGLQRRWYGNEKRAFTLRISDDTYPCISTRIFPGEDSKVKHRNFFLDQQEIIKGRKKVDWNWRTWQAEGGSRLWRERSHDWAVGITTAFLVKYGEITKIPWYDTHFGEVLHFTEGFVFRTPPYLLHAGGISTYKQGQGESRRRQHELFGGYSFNPRNRVTPARDEFVEKVMRNSGVSNREGFLSRIKSRIRRTPF